MKALTRVSTAGMSMSQVASQIPCWMQGEHIHAHTQKNPLRSHVRGQCLLADYRLSALLLHAFLSHNPKPKAGEVLRLLLLLSDYTSLETHNALNPLCLSQRFRDKLHRAARRWKPENYTRLLFWTIRDKSRNHNRALQKSIQKRHNSLWELLQQTGLLLCIYLDFFCIFTFVVPHYYSHKISH